RAPLDAAGRAARTDDGAPRDCAGGGIQRPEDPALLPDTEDVANQVRSGSGEVEVRTGRIGAVHCCERDQTCDGPRVVAGETPRPLHRTAREIEVEHGLEEIIRGGAV